VKPKQQTNNDAIGEEALRLLTESGIVVAGVALADMHAAKKARKARLKEVMTSIWKGFDQGLTFNGYQSKEEWAANFAKVTMRHCQHIVYGRKTDEANKSSLTINFDKIAEALTAGRKVFATEGGFKYKLNKFLLNRKTIYISIADPARDKKEQTKKVARLTLRQTYIVINAVRKQVGKDDRTIEWAQRQYDGILALNGAEKKPHYSAYRTALKHAKETLQGRIQHKETEERMAKITHLVADGEPEYSMCARKNMQTTTDINAVECEECRQDYEQQKKYDAMKLVHAAGNIINPDNPRTVRCSNGGSRPKITDDKKKVTCPNCLRGLDQDEQISWFPDFEKTVPKGVTKDQKDDLWRVYLRARRGSIYDPENVTETPCKDPAEAMDWYRKYVVVVCPSSKEEAE